MNEVAVEAKSIEDYIESAGAPAVDELRRLATPLRDLRVLHVNATPVGGGVAEMLQSEIPLLRHLGLQAEWRTITAEPAFFEVTKRIHNGLQGAPIDLTAAEQLLFTECQQANAAQLTDTFDVVVVHDPPASRPAPVHRQGARRLDLAAPRRLLPVTPPGLVLPAPLPRRL